MTWIQHTRPELAARVNFLSQCTDKNYKEKIDLYNKAVTEVQKDPRRGIKMKPLDVQSLHIKVFSDSAFANNTDMSSQLGFSILLCDKNNNCNIIQFSSHKSRRIVRSILDGEIYPFADAFDTAYTIKRDLEEMLERRVSLQMLTDSKTLFDIITKCSGTT